MTKQNNNVILEAITFAAVEQSNCGKDQVRRNAAHHHAVMKTMIGLKSYLTRSLMPNISLDCRWVTPNKNDTSDDARMTY